MREWLGSDLRQPSFRGVEFDVDDAAGTSGRDTTTHRYAQRDEVYVADNQAAAKVYRLKCVVRGEDWLARGRALLAALNTPGPGELIHPIHGALRVAVSEPVEDVCSSAGEWTFDCVFTETTDPQFPATADLKSGEALSRATSLLASAKAAFVAGYNTARAAGTVIEDAIDKATDRVEAIQDAIREYGDPAPLGKVLVAGQSLLASIDSLIATPGELADRWQAMLGGLGLLASDAALLAGTLGDLASETAARATLGTLTDTDQQAANNAAAQDRLLWMTALAHAAAAGTAATWDTYDDAAAGQAALATQFDAAIASATSMDDLGALIDLKTATLQAIADAAAGAPHVVSWSIPEPLPTLAIAQLWYGDGLRATEIRDRNRTQIPHPLFATGTVALTTE